MERVIYSRKFRVGITPQGYEKTSVFILTYLSESYEFIHKWRFSFWPLKIKRCKFLKHVYTITQYLPELEGSFYKDANSIINIAKIDEINEAKSWLLENMGVIYDKQ